MKGTVKAYSSSVNAGVIECRDGKTYNFPASEWQGNESPIVNDRVTFDGHERAAKRVSAQR